MKNKASNYTVISFNFRVLQGHLKMVWLTHSLFALVVVLVLETAVCDKTDNCVYSSFLMRCKGTIPVTIPHGVTEVELEELRPEKLVENAFCQISWTNVSKLAISCFESTCSVKFDISEAVFHCLENLTHMKLQYDVLTNFSSDTFSGLQNLVSLDLSGCLRLCTPALVTALTNTTSLPKLSSLILVNIGNVFCSLEIIQTLVDILGVRNLTLINLSGSSIRLVNPDMAPLCDTLKTVNLSYSDLVKSSIFRSVNYCNSLRILDVTGMKLPKIPPLPGFINLTNFHIVANNSAGPFRGFFRPFFRRLSTVYANSVISRDHVIYLQNCSLLVTAPNDLNTLEVCGYNFVNFDLVINLTYNDLKYLKISNNNMASIGANVFKYLKLLKGISLANNKLSRASSFHKTFTNLFRSNELLLEIDLSNNELNDLPSGTFALTTLLERVCLSGNRFQEITFDIDHLVNLKLLDMRNNSVTSLNAASRNSLDRLYEKLRTKNDTGDFQIDLRENPFTCVCKSKSFLKWFVNSPIFSTTRDEYHCQAGETILPMNEEAIREAEEDCERPIRRRRILILSSVLPVCGLLILIIIMIRLVKYRKKTLMQQQFEDRVRLIQEGELGCTFPVFLSYSNDDANFVDIHILRPLKVS